MPAKQSKATTATNKTAAEVIKAVDLAPQAFGGAGSGKKDALEGKPDDLQYDLHHLAALDSHPVDLEAFQADPEGYLRGVATFAVQGIVSRLFDLPCEDSLVGPVATLPSPTTALPRMKVLPALKKETRWGEFAKEKGIQNRKRARMLWDEEAQEWRPRWGYKRAKGGVEDQAIVEVKQGDDPYKDPWTEARQAKKARVQKNLGQQRKNMGIDPKGPAFGLPVDLVAGKKDAAQAAGDNNKKKGAKQQPQGKQKGKAAGMKALEVAQQSTASLGRFDPKLAGEPAKKAPRAKKAIAAVADAKALGQESQKMQSIMNAVLRPKGEGSGRGKHVNIDALEPAGAGYNRKKGRGAVKAGGKKGKGKGKK